MDSAADSIKNACQTLRSLQPEGQALGATSEDDLMDVAEILGV